MTDLPPFSDANAEDLINAIKTGRWDLYLSEIINACGDRRQMRREALLAQVHEIYGPNYTIKAER